MFEHRDSDLGIGLEWTEMDWYEECVINYLLHEEKNNAQLNFHSEMDNGGACFWTPGSRSGQNHRKERDTRSTSWNWLLRIGVEQRLGVAIDFDRLNPKKRHFVLFVYPIPLHSLKKRPMYTGII